MGRARYAPFSIWSTQMSNISVFRPRTRQPNDSEVVTSLLLKCHSRGMTVYVPPASGVIPRNSLYYSQEHKIMAINCQNPERAKLMLLRATNNDTNVFLMWDVCNDGIVEKNAPDGIEDWLDGREPWNC